MASHPPAPSPFQPQNPSPALPVTGFDAAGVACGIKKSGALDLAIIASQVPCRAAAVFTQNSFPAASVLYNRNLLALNSEMIHGVVINSGNANACTGVEGAANNRLMAEAAEMALGATDNTLCVMSTGVIGAQLPIAKIQAGIPPGVNALTSDGWETAARAIMTTDSYPKWASVQLHMDGVDVTMTGIAKGAGMIHPNMATMLSALATDVHITQPLLQQALTHAVNRSFNRISIDGDSSTNDTVLVLANGLAGNPEITDSESASYQAFQDGLTQLCTQLAKEVVRNGEGVTKFVTVQIEGAVADADAHRIANAIATSPLVKTAFFGGDANWGRIMCAVGYSGAQVVPEKAQLLIQPGQPGDGRPELQLFAAGTPTGYAEADAAAIFAEPEISIRIVLGLGEGSTTVWTSDLSHEYVTINGDYRT